MAKITINVGTVANDGTGDTLRGAFQNVNANFTEVYNYINITGPYANDSVAAASNVALMGLYYTAQGNVKIRLV